MKQRSARAEQNLWKEITFLNSLPGINAIKTTHESPGSRRGFFIFPASLTQQHPSLSLAGLLAWVSPYFKRNFKYASMKYYFALILSTWTLGLSAQVSGNANYQNHTAPADNTAKAGIADGSITIAVKGLFNLVPDDLVASFHLTQIGETARVADSLMAHRIKTFKTAISMNTADTIAIVTDVISFVPKYNFHIINRLFSKTYQEIPDGFELKKNILIHYKNPKSLYLILTAAASAEIHDLVKVDYFLKDVKENYNQLREECLLLLKDKIKNYEALGFKLEGFRKTISDDFGTLLPHDRYGNYQAVAKPSYDAIKMSTGGGKLRIAETGNSSYYQAVSYNAFDLVINPVVNQPMVQLTYEIAIMFFVPKAPGEKELLFMSPDGQLQKIDLENLPPGR
jgi:hypothetical protein